MRELAVRTFSVGTWLVMVPARSAAAGRPWRVRRLRVAPARAVPHGRAGSAACGVRRARAERDPGLLGRDSARGANALMVGGGGDFSGARSPAVVDEP